VSHLRRAVNATSRNLHSLTRSDVLTLADLLWTSNVYEHRQAAVHLLTRHTALLSTVDLLTVEAMLRGARTWAGGHPRRPWRRCHHPPAQGSSRNCPRPLGHRPGLLARRSALLALLPGIRANAADLKRLSRYTDAMLEEPEFFIRKAIGWVLRETTRRDHHFVTTWVESHIDRISGVTLREAVRRLHDTDRTRLINAYRRTHRH
jgi:hypothetical protein